MPDLPESACVRAARLKLAREKIATGTAESEVAFESGNGVEQRVRYTMANLPALDRLIAAAERDCAAERGERIPRRHAMGVRFRRY